MSIPVKLVKYLEKNKIKYKLLEHKKIFTALDLSKSKKIKPQLIVKTLVMQIDKNYCLALLPANKNLDKNKFKKAAEKIGIKKIDFAREAWMKKNLMGKVGATPAFGKLLKLPVLMDAPLFKNKELILNSGDYQISLIVSTKQFIKLEEPSKAHFSKAKK